MPEFITASTAYALNRRLENAKTPKEFFARFTADDYALRNETAEISEMMYERRVTQYHGEKLLWELGRPYYKIWPDYLDAFRRTKLHIPRRYLKLPFPSWEIRLPDGEQPCTFGSGPTYVTTIWVMHVHDLVADTERDRFMKAVALDCEAPEDRMHILLLCLTDSRERRLTVPLALRGDDSTVEEALQNVLAQNPTDEIRAQQLREIFSIVLTTIGLVTGNDDIVEIDVLAGDAHKLRPGMPAVERERLHERSFKRRLMEGKGYTIGRRERLVHVAKQRESEIEVDGEGRPLTYSHFRCGHLHKYNTREGFVLRWIPMLTVRPDLPPDPRGRSGVQIK